MDSAARRNIFAYNERPFFNFIYFSHGFIDSAAANLLRQHIAGVTRLPRGSINGPLGSF